MAAATVVVGAGVQGGYGAKWRVLLRAEVRPPVGMGLAGTGSMGARDFTELICWQLARDLNSFVCSVTERPNVLRNRGFCEQAETAASSAPRNIAEGFGRYDHKEFAQFLKIAIGSLQETRHLILEAFDRGYVTEKERDHGLALGRRAVAATVRFRLYLLTSPTPSRRPHSSRNAPAP